MAVTVVEYHNSTFDTFVSVNMTEVSDAIIFPVIPAKAQWRLQTQRSGASTYTLRIDRSIDGVTWNNGATTGTDATPNSQLSDRPVRFVRIVLSALGGAQTVSGQLLLINNGRS